MNQQNEWIYFLKKIWRYDLKPALPFYYLFDLDIRWSFQDQFLVNFVNELVRDKLKIN